MTLVPISFSLTISRSLRHWLVWPLNYRASVLSWPISIALGQLPFYITNPGLSTIYQAVMAPSHLEPRIRFSQHLMALTDLLATLKGRLGGRNDTSSNLSLAWDLKLTVTMDPLTSHCWFSIDWRGWNTQNTPRVNGLAVPVMINVAPAASVWLQVSGVSA